MHHVHQHDAPSAAPSPAACATSEPTSEPAPPFDRLRAAKHFLWGMIAGFWVVMLIETVTAYW